MTSNPPLHLLHLHSFPIFKQLQIEEALLRADERDWCLINYGAPPAIVMGISCKAELYLNQTLLTQQPIQTIRRFSGGGTVVVDEDTLFVTFICNSVSFNISCCPQKIFHWTEEFYQSVFEGHNFRLHENDYVLGNKKCGGNAQYLSKNRWLHHTSLLWDYKPEQMDYLLMPPKMPKYRENRLHHHFLCKLRDIFPLPGQFTTKLTSVLEKKFDLKKMPLESIDEILQKPHRKATTIL